MAQHILHQPLLPDFSVKACFGAAAAAGRTGILSPALNLFPQQHSKFGPNLDVPPQLPFAQRVSPLNGFLTQPLKLFQQLHRNRNFL